MQLDEVLPEVMGSLVPSELLLSGEGPPWVCSRMDQYQRKMRKPVGERDTELSRPAVAPLPQTPPSRVPWAQIGPLRSFGHRLPWGLGAPATCQPCAISCVPSHLGVLHSCKARPPQHH